MIDKNYKKSFTLIELIVVATIIGLLAAAGVVSYSQFSKQSRDARRKADLEQMRAAIELYKSANNKYPNTADGTSITFNTGTCTPNPTSLIDINNTYLSKIPSDPRCSSGTPVYYYSSSDGSSYTIAAYLESSSASGCAGADSCGTGYNCNYCLGPYGQTN